jgi:uncharacterized protein with PIN domain
MLGVNDMNRQRQSQLPEPQFSIDDIPNNPQLQEMKYVYVIHGPIPELAARVAYRRIGAEVQHQRKILKCPFCASRLSDMDAETNVELYGHEKHVQIQCQFYLRCINCHKEVGINIA